MICGRTHLLEAMVQGELPATSADELRAHANGCAKCHHELNWLLTERKLFRTRAGREEVQQLWSAVSQRVDPRRAARQWSRVAVAFAASLLAVVGLSRVTRSQSPSTSSPSVVMQSEPLESEPMMSSAVGTDEACSRLPQGLGFHCGPALPMSVLASR
jgi:anti-sigma factor RsiW